MDQLSSELKELIKRINSECETHKSCINCLVCPLFKKVRELHGYSICDLIDIIEENLLIEE